MRAIFVVPFCLGASLACSSSDSPTPLGATHTRPPDAASDVTQPGADATSDVRTEDAHEDACEGCADAGADAYPSGWIPATSGALATAFEADLAATGEERVDDLDVVANAGRLSLSGAEHRGVVYLAHDWASAGFVLFDFISVALDGSDLAVTYLYCQGPDLGYAYTESFRHPLDWEVTTGTCDTAMQSTVVQVDLPALSARPTPIDTGIEIAGSSITLDAGGGSVVLAGQSWTLTPFNTVDCTDCPDGPWYELHCMLERADEGCFGILYLFPDQPGQVMLSNVVCLPSLATPSQVFDAAWTGVVPPMLPILPWRPRP